MPKLLLLFVLFFYQSVFAQHPYSSFSRLLTSDSIKKNVFILASDSLEGRETGKPGQKKAADFIAGKYIEYGLSVFESENYPTNSRNKYLQNHSISLKDNKSRNLSVNGKNYLFGKDFFYHSLPADSFLLIDKIQFILAGKSAASPLLINKINEHKGAAIFIEDSENGFTESDTVLHLPESATNTSIFFLITKEAEIRAMFSQNKTVSKTGAYVLYVSRNVARELFELEAEAYERMLKKKVKSSAAVTIKKSCRISVALLKNTEELSGQNVMALIPGSEFKNETIVVSAHYDHLGKRDSLIYYGADDNASGTAALIEMARVLKSVESTFRPKRNILFLNVSGEEKNLLGSSWFVENPITPLSEFVANLNIDMIGRTDHLHDSMGVRNYVYIIGSNRMSSRLHRVNETMNDLGPRLELNYRYNDPDEPNNFYRRSDHYNFVKNNIPVIFYFNGIHDDYHKPSDTAAKIDFELLLERTRLVFMTALELANMPERIKPDVDSKPKE